MCYLMSVFITSHKYGLSQYLIRIHQPTEAKASSVCDTYCLFKLLLDENI